MHLFLGMDCISFTESIMIEKLIFRMQTSKRNSAINSAGLHWVWQRVKETASLQMLMDSTFSEQKCVEKKQPNSAL